MRFWSTSRGLFVILSLTVVLGACALNQGTNEDPPEIPPTITLAATSTLPFTVTPTASDTPVVTDTLPPQPTNTATPTDVPTIAPTPSPVMQGAIGSGEIVNVRTEPNTNADIVITLEPNTEIDILGADRNQLQQIWYLVRYEDENGVIYEGYVSSILVDDRGQIIPTIVPTATPTPEGFDPNATIAPFLSATPDENEGFTPEAILTPSRDLSQNNILAYCIEDGIRPSIPTDDETISIYWRWWVVPTRPELMQDHLDNVEYEVLLDGKLLTEWANFNTEMVQDPTNSNRWTVFWYVPVGKLDAGEHTITYRVSWNTEITDGIDTFGPGTNTPEQTGTCNFTVVEAQ